MVPDSQAWGVDCRGTEESHNGKPLHSLCTHTPRSTFFAFCVWEGCSSHTFLCFTLANKNVSLLELGPLFIIHDAYELREEVDEYV